MPRKPLPAALADEVLALVDPADPSLAVPDFSEPEPEPPAPESDLPPTGAWWLRTGVPGAVRHKRNPKVAGSNVPVSYCNLTLRPERFHRATPAEVRTTRACPICCPTQKRRRDR